MAKLFDSPYQPARAAVQALVPAVKPGHGGGNEAQVLVTHILGRIDQLAAEHPDGVVPSAEADELRGQIAHLIELVCPLVTGQDADERKANAERRAWVQDAFRLATGHLSL